MRKGIMALTRNGKGKAPANKKTQNTEPLETKMVIQALPEEEAPQERPFVQTILVPKPGTVVKKNHRKHKKVPYNGR